MSVEAWKEGKIAETINIEAESKGKGIARSAETITKSLKETLQYAMKQIIPKIINVLEK